MKKIVSVLLCIVMLFSLSSVAFAAYEGENRLPIVMIEGRGPTSEIWNQDGTVLYPFSIDKKSVAKAVAECIPLLSYGLSTGNYDPWVDRFVKEMGQYYAPIIADKDGNLPEGTYLNGERNGENGFLYYYYGIDYLFRYDWRRSPVDIASDLDKYIKAIKAETGVSKVSIVGRCMGANVLSAYFEQFGCDDIDTAIYYTSTANGTYAATNAFCGTVSIDAEALINYVDKNDILGDAVLSEFIRAAVDSADYIGGVNGISDFATKFLEKIYPHLAPKLLLATYAAFPSFWTLVDTDKYESAKSFVFSGREEEYKNYIALIDDYHYNVQAKLESIIDDCIAKGMKFASVAKYNTASYPFFKNSNELGDNTVTVKSAAFGGTYADFGKVLSDEYLSSADMKYVSSDHMVDASSCRYKDSTWFVKDIIHGYYPYCIDQLLRAICNSETQMTVFDDENYPQFLKYDTERETINPLTDEPKDSSGAKQSFLVSLKNLFVSFFKLIRQLFDKLGKKQ